MLHSAAIGHALLVINCTEVPKQISIPSYYKHSEIVALDVDTGVVRWRRAVHHGGLPIFVDDQHVSVNDGPNCSMEWTPARLLVLSLDSGHLDNYYAGAPPATRIWQHDDLLIMANLHSQEAVRAVDGAPAWIREDRQGWTQDGPQLIAELSEGVLLVRDFRRERILGVDPATGRVHRVWQLPAWRNDDDTDVKSRGWWGRVHAGPTTVSAWLDQDWSGSPLIVWHTDGSRSVFQLPKGTTGTNATLIADTLLVWSERGVTAYDLASSGRQSMSRTIRFGSSTSF